MLSWLLLPTVVLLLLDSYYLALERAFRNSYNGFVSRLHGGRRWLHRTCMSSGLPA